MTCVRGLRESAGLQTLAEAVAVAPPCAAALGCSVAAVQQAGPLELLVSTGHGDLVLLSGAGSGAAPAVSAAAQPLPQAQPFVLEAAYRASAGAVVAALHSSAASLAPYLRKLSPPSAPAAQVATYAAYCGACGRARGRSRRTARCMS